MGQVAQGLGLKDAFWPRIRFDGATAVDPYDKPKNTVEILLAQAHGRGGRFERVACFDY